MPLNRILISQEHRGFFYYPQFSILKQMEGEDKDISRREFLTTMAGMGVLMPLSLADTAEERVEEYESLLDDEKVRQLEIGLWAISFRVRSLENQMDEIMKPRKTPDNKGSI